jgi:acyl dehydratase
MSFLSQVTAFVRDFYLHQKRESTMPQMINKSEIGNYIGHVCEPTPWFEVTQEQVNEFAECTIDRQFIHIDPVALQTRPLVALSLMGFLRYLCCLTFLRATI